MECICFLVIRMKINLKRQKKKLLTYMNFHLLSTRSPYLKWIFSDKSRTETNHCFRKAALTSVPVHIHFLQQPQGCNPTKTDCPAAMRMEKLPSISALRPHISHHKPLNLENSMFPTLGHCGFISRDETQRRLHLCCTHSDAHFSSTPSSSQCPAFLGEQESQSGWSQIHCLKVKSNEG